MTRTEQKKQLKRLATGIRKVLGKDTCESMQVQEGDGYLVLAWEGLFEWPSTIGSGASIMAGELGNWGGSKTEPAIAAAIEKVEADGCHFEAINGWSVAVFD